MGMEQINKAHVFLITLLIFLVSTNVAFAKVIDVDTDVKGLFTDLNEPSGGGFTSLTDYAAVAVNLFLGIAMSITLIGVILSGIKFMAAKSDFKAIASAKAALTYSIVGLLLSIGAFAFLRIIIDILN